ncbi:type III secretion system export apparatus subunit SctR [Salinicola avicenniae]|uniref:type III secretion system export apparatus subunit SctR n=1 Tax=Salinicola avicenniae TaxID=2916836 RepID=UPI002072D79F|nr:MULTISPECIES: type III secretion system export apparatus subunit SctR [unclassified Salinicola]
MNLEQTNLIMLTAVLAAMSLLPLLMIVSTAFLKIAIVLMITRSALGVQQVPPNIAIYSIALAATLFIMAPVGYSVAENFRETPADFSNVETLQESVVGGLSPVSDFMQRNANPDLIAHLDGMTRDIWPEEISREVGSDSLVIVLPAFVLSELQKGFESGFLIYIPFIVVDLIVSNLLLALGMQMVSPMTISLPLKILLFVMVSGWTHLLDSLFYSYQ